MITIHVDERTSNDLIRAAAGMLAGMVGMVLTEPKIFKDDSVPLTDGDAPPRREIQPGGIITIAGLPGQGIAGNIVTDCTGVVAAPKEPSEPIDGDPTSGPTAPEAKRTRRTRRTRAQIAAEKLAAAPDGGEQLPLGMPTPEVPTAPLAPTAPAAAVVPAAPTAPVTSVPVVPTIASSGATTDVDAPTTFPTLMRALSPLLSGKKLTADLLNQACAAAGCTNLQGLLQKQELVPQVYARALAAVSA